MIISLHVAEIIVLIISGNVLSNNNILFLFFDLCQFALSPTNPFIIFNKLEWSFNKLSQYTIHWPNGQ